MERPAESGADLSVRLRPVGDLDALGAAWRALEGRAAASFFQSWGWIGCWLRLLPPEAAPRLLEVRADDGRIVGLGLLGRGEKRRHGLLRSTGLFLNETGDPAYDRLTIEYNGLLAEDALAEAVEARAFGWLAANEADWDELYLSGIDAARAARYRAAGEALGLYGWLYDRKRCDFVDLAGLRAAGRDHAAALSRNTRYQIRRARRLYGIDENAGVEVAASVEEALAFLDRLKALHQAYWRRRGQSGAFASPFFETFHRALVRDRFAAGEIQLLRVSAAGTAIGYLYNFVHDGHVYAYQSGFRYDDDPKLKPGLVTHAMAIEHNLRAGARVYDFMAGEGRHKASLGTDSIELFWLVLQRDRARFRVERTLRRVKQGMRRKERGT